MASTNKILVVIDPTSATQPALERIAHLPRPLKAQVTLLICDSLPHVAIEDQLASEAVARACAALMVDHGKYLEQLAAPLRAQGLDVHVDVRGDYPLHEAIIRKAVEWGADLVVKDTHFHSLARRTIFSNTDWNLIRHCPAQLLLVKPRPIGSLPCVVAALDPLHPRDKAASLDDRILTCAIDFAALVGGQTHVLHAFDVAPAIVGSSDARMMPIALPIAEITAEMERSHTEAVRTIAERHGIAPERVQVLQGGVRRVLVDATDELRADVVVMGAVSRNALVLLCQKSWHYAWKVTRGMSCHAEAEVIGV
jgi:universal stress protein E